VAYLGAVAAPKFYMPTAIQRAIITQAQPAPVLPWTFPTPVIRPLLPVPVETLPVLKPLPPTIPEVLKPVMSAVATATPSVPSSDASPPLSFASLFGGGTEGSNLTAATSSLLPIALVSAAAWFLLQPKKRRR
jgi:hypothetical protein